MNGLARLTACLALLGALAVGCVNVPGSTHRGYPDEPPTTTRATNAATSRITEDDPRWDCRTMGNGICGPGGDQ